jgi:hypothetical protein
VEPQMGSWKAAEGAADDGGEVAALLEI